MHFIVTIRHLFFITTILSSIGLAVVSALGVANSVVLSPGLLFFSLLMTIYFLAIIAFDLNRTRTGFGYFSFVFKIWWEFLSVCVFLAVIATLLVIGLSKPQGAACQSGRGSDLFGPHVCSVTHGIWAWEIILLVLMFCYITFLGVAVIDCYYETPGVLRAGVRDFNWKGSQTRRPNHDSYSTFGSSSGSLSVKKSTSTSNISKPLPRPFLVNETSVQPPTFVALQPLERTYYREKSRFFEGV